MRYRVLCLQLDAAVFQHSEPLDLLALTIPHGDAKFASRLLNSPSALLVVPSLSKGWLMQQKGEELGTTRPAQLKRQHY